MQYKKPDVIKFFLKLHILTNDSPFFKDNENIWPGSCISCNNVINPGVWAKHCSTELKKQVFPKFVRPWNKAFKLEKKTDKIYYIYLFFENFNGNLNTGELSFLLVIR